MLKKLGDCYFVCLFLIATAFTVSAEDDKLQKQIAKALQEIKEIQSPINIEEAEGIAETWWSCHYRPDQGYGAAWIQKPHHGYGALCCVGISRGRMSEPDKRYEDSQYLSPSGGYYAAVACFGSGITWEEALLDACKSSHWPMRDRAVDEKAYAAFLKRIGK